MPTSNQAKKRVRQNEKHRLRHKAKRTEIKTLQKKLLKDMSEKKDAAALAAEMKSLQIKLDKAGKTRTLHPNTVARQKSRLQRKLNKLAAKK
ncbi:MAG TPA: 30S ribosomal protein S20 [Planctomycetota bacterium]|nr:30S ribosomal protein S20 [Planctomycetota bacterium]